MEAATLKKITRMMRKEYSKKIFRSWFSGNCQSYNPKIPYFLTAITFKSFGKEKYREYFFYFEDVSCNTKCCQMQLD